MCVIVITIVFNYFSLCVTVSLMSVHTCIILVSMYLHCYSEFIMSVHTCIIPTHLLIISESLSAAISHMFVYVAILPFTYSP